MTALSPRGRPGRGRTRFLCPIASLGSLLLGVPVVAHAQEPVEQGVRLGITYTPGMRPGMLVLGGPRRERLDSVRTIIQRDLEFSDRFEMIYLPGGDSLVLGVGSAAESPSSPRGAELFVNYSLYSALGADYAVSVLEEYDSTLSVNLYDVAGEAVSASVRIDSLTVSAPEFRMAVHRAADAIVRAATGEYGAAASRVLFVSRGRLYSVDSDGANTHVVSAPDVATFSPAWAPDARSFAYTELTDDGWGSIVIQERVTGRRRTVTPTTEYLNLSADFSPDGATLVFSRGWDEGTQLFSYNVAQDCCLQRLTVGRLSDNLSPAFGPDGRRIAFESNRVGLAQIYIMLADGTDQELFAPYDYGVTGDSHSPAWSPDGLNIAFHRTVAGSPQIFVMDVRSRSVRQLTSAGRNEDPTWAPDGRHLAYKSNRTGAEQVWVMDIETGRVRQLTRLGLSRMPSWSPSITESNQP
jgi:TolB protein